MRFGNVKFIDSSNGDGVRVSLYVSGCRNACKGCFNPETWNFKFGEEYTKETEDSIIEGCKKEYISGLSILGGEPFEEENQREVLALIERFRREVPNKTIWMWSGYTIEDELNVGKRKNIEGVTLGILKNIDVLVEGRFVLEKRNVLLAHRGSENQRVLNKKEIFNKISL